MSYPTLFTTPGVRAFAEEIDAERQRQLAKWGEQRHADGTGDSVSRAMANTAKIAEQTAAQSPGGTTWSLILQEEVYEALAEADPTKLRAELIQVAAICQAWIHDLDSRTS